MKHIRDPLKAVMVENGESLLYIFYMTPLTENLYVGEQLTIFNECTLQLCQRTIKRYS